MTLAETSELVAKADHPAMAARLDISDPAVVDGVRERVADELGRVASRESAGGLRRHIGHNPQSIPETTLSHRKNTAPAVKT